MSAISSGMRITFHVSFNNTIVTSKKKNEKKTSKNKAMLRLKYGTSLALKLQVNRIVFKKGEK